MFIEGIRRWISFRANQRRTAVRRRLLRSEASPRISNHSAADRESDRQAGTERQDARHAGVPIVDGRRVLAGCPSPRHQRPWHGLRNSDQPGLAVRPQDSSAAGIKVSETLAEFADIGRSIESGAQRDGVLAFCGNPAS